MAAVDHIDALRRSPVLAGLPEDALGRLAACAEPVDVPAGEVVIAEGGPADAMYLVETGELEVSKTIGDADVPLATLGPGDPVGEVGLVNDRPRTATVRTLRDSRLLRIDAGAFEELLTAPGSARRLLATTTRRLEEQEILLRQHARMATLGSLSAGLLHELNNPAAALGRSVAHLRELVLHETPLPGLDSLPTPAAEAARRVMEAMDEAAGADRHLDPLERSDRSARLQDWLAGHGVDRPSSLAPALAAAEIDAADLEPLAAELPADRLGSVVSALARRSEIAATLDEAAQGTARISEIVAAVKAYSHHGEAPVGDVSVVEGLEQALVILDHKRPAGVRIVRDFAPDLPRIEGYPGDLNSVWTNLIDNAIDAVGDTGEIVLAARPEDDAVVVEVTDTGPGIPPDVAERVFDPFYTTKGVGQGTGLGLATSHAIVTGRHLGRLTLDSRPGRTRFTVRLPRRLARPESDDHSSSPVP